MRVAVLLLLLAGCSSESSSDGPADLSAPSVDLSSPSVACTFTYSGDQSGSRSCEIVNFCSLGGSSLFRIDDGLGHADLEFQVAGQFTTGRSYAATNLESFQAVFITGFGTMVSYAAGNEIAGSTVTLTLTDLGPPEGSCPSSGTPHGAAHVGGLIEQLDDDGGTNSPGHVTLDATF